MSRILKEGWLQTYRKYVYKQESPDLFHFWVGMTMISGALRRHVWIDRSAYKIFPNLYVFLVEESAESRKSTAMELGLSLLSAVSTRVKNIRIVHESMTVEGLMDAMHKAEVTSTGTIRMDGSIVIHADELSNLFSKKTYTSGLMSFLTAAFTAKSKLEFLTRNKNYTQLENVCPVVLAGTTPEIMGEIFPSTTMSGGFLGRVVLVTAKRGKREAEPEIRKELKEPLIEDLYRISLLEGEVKMTDEAKAAFKDWYDNKLDAIPLRDSAPFFHRKHDHTLKTAMLLSISESDDMVVTLDHFLKARDAIDYLEAKIPTAVKQIGATDKANLGDLVYSIVAKNHPEAVAHSVLLRRVYHKVQDGDEFQKIIDTLVGAGRITSEARRSGVFYKILKQKSEEV